MITCGMSSRLIQVTSVPAGIVSSIGPKLKLSMVTAFVAGFSWAAVTEGRPIAPLISTSERVRMTPAFIDRNACGAVSSLLFQNLMGISLSLKCGIHNRQSVFAANQVDVGNAQHAMQSFGRYFHRTRRIRLARCRLRKRGRPRRVERNIAFDLLHDLVYVPVQNRHGPKSLQVRKRLLAVVGAPTPLGINRPERDVREDNDRRAALQSSDIFLNPFELLRAEISKATCLEIQHIDQADEMG